MQERHTDNPGLADGQQPAGLRGDELLVRRPYLRRNGVFPPVEKGRTGEKRRDGQLLTRFAWDVFLHIVREVRQVETENVGDMLVAFVEFCVQNPYVTGFDV